MSICAHKIASLTYRLTSSEYTIELDGRRARGWLVPVYADDHTGGRPARFQVELTFEENDPAHRKVFDQVGRCKAPVDVTLNIQGVNDRITVPAHQRTSFVADPLSMDSFISEANSPPALAKRLEIVDQEGLEVLFNALAE